MPARTTLGELELVILVALIRLGDGAYGAAIREEIEDRTGRRLSPGAIYPTLDRLEKKGLVRSYVGEPEPTPGGRSRRHFVLKPEGLQQAQAAWRQIERLARGVKRLQSERS